MLFDYLFGVGELLTNVKAIQRATDLIATVSLLQFIVIVILIIYIIKNKEV
jgi:hypothetical protein